MSDPIRSKLLFAVAEKKRCGASVRQLAEKTGEPKRRVRYHLDALAEEGLVTVAGEKPRRGVVERYYRAEQMPLLTSKETGPLDEDQTRTLSIQILRAILADARAATAARTFGSRPGDVTMRVPGDVDLQGWQELAEVHQGVLDELLGIIERSEERLRSTGESPIKVVSVLLLFEAPAWPS